MTSQTNVASVSPAFQNLREIPAGTITVSPAPATSVAGPETVLSLICACAKDELRPDPQDSVKMSATPDATLRLAPSAKIEPASRPSREEG